MRKKIIVAIEPINTTSLRMNKLEMDIQTKLVLKS